MKIKIQKVSLTMAEMGINYSTLSELSGVSRATISYIKNGKSCRPDVVNKIAAALNVDVTEIIEQDGR